jgi:phosphonate degradation associated HDIG domain protein
MENTTLKVEAAIEAIFNLYRQHGNHEYGEQVTMSMHMVQAALQAEKEGSNDELVVAAFLHDIGHFFEHEEHMGILGTMKHDELGGTYLMELGFPEKMAKLVASHVQAKRYLVAVDEAYYETLSDASRETLAYQGGPMSADEIAAFRQDPLYPDYIRIRIWDDMGKDADTPVTEKQLEHLREKTYQYLLANFTDQAKV